MSKTLKVTTNDVKFARFVLLPVSEEAKTWLSFFRSMYNKTIIRLGFCDIQSNQGLGKGYQLKPKPLPRPWLFWISQKPHPIIVYLLEKSDDGNENVTKRKVLLSRTMVLHVRYKSLYISLPSSTKQQREMTKFCANASSTERGRRRLIFRISHL